MLHELSARGDLIRVETVLNVGVNRWVFYALLSPVISQCGLLLLGSLRFLRSSEPTSTLLIHLRPRGHAIDRHVNQLRRPNQFHQTIHVVEDIDEHIIQGQWYRDTTHLRVRAWMNDTVHVQVEVIDLWVSGWLTHVFRVLLHIP